MPSTRTGRYALGFMMGFVFFHITAMLIVASGQRGGDTLFDNLWISVPVILAVLSTLAALVTSGIALLRDGETGWMVRLTGGISLLMIAFLLAVLLFSD